MALGDELGIQHAQFYEIENYVIAKVAEKSGRPFEEIRLEYQKSRDQSTRAAQDFTEVNPIREQRE